MALVKATMMMELAGYFAAYVAKYPANSIIIVALINAIILNSILSLKISIMPN